MCIWVKTIPFKKNNSSVKLYNFNRTNLNIIYDKDLQQPLAVIKSMKLFMGVPLCIFNTNKSNYFSNDVIFENNMFQRHSDHRQINFHRIRGKLSFKIWFDHEKPYVYSIEFDKCPGCIDKIDMETH